MSPLTTPATRYRTKRKGWRVVKRYPSAKDLSVAVAACGSAAHRICGSRRRKARRLQPGDDGEGGEGMQSTANVAKPTLVSIRPREKEEGTPFAFDIAFAVGTVVRLLCRLPFPLTVSTRVRSFRTITSRSS